MTTSTLGRGLGSLIPSKKNAAAGQAAGEVDEREKILQLEVNKIKPNPQQPRKHFSRDSLEDLINSIKVHGIIQPLVVLETDEGYQLITGERRLRATKMLGEKKVPVIVRSATEQQKLELALVENVQRENLNPIEKAIGYQQLIDEYSLTQEEMAKKVGQSRAAVGNTLRLLSLPQEIQKAIIESKITEGHAKVLLSVQPDSERQRLYKEILKNRLSVRVTENQARAMTTVRKHKRKVNRDPNIREKEDQLQEALGTKVEIIRKGHQGTVVVHFYSPEELQEIIRKISK